MKPGWPILTFLLTGLLLSACRHQTPVQELPVSEPSTPLAEMIFTVFDTETTGLRTPDDRVIEIGCVQFRGQEILSETNWLINPQRSIPWTAHRIHGIDDRMVADAPLISDILPRFLAFTEGSPLLAHNAGFDMRFMRSELRHAGQAPLPNCCYNTLPLFRRWYPGFSSHALGNLARELRVETGTAHRALDDARTVTRIFQGYLLRNPNITFAEFTAQCGKVHAFTE